MTSANDSQPFVFDPASTAVGSDSAHVTPTPIQGNQASDHLVQVTVREIAEIVREVAAASRSDRSIEQFLTFFVDRVLRAMAAEGVIVWRRSQRSDDLLFEPLRSIGRLTESSLPGESLATHQRLLCEVAQQRQSVVVPPTPGAIDADVPANPMQVPAAVVAMDHDPSAMHSEYVLEVFLEPEGGVATQRGYLRFAAQMADLAGEFLRAGELRELKRSSQLSARVDACVASLHQQTSTANVEASITDGAADVFQLDQVGLCYLDDSRVHLAAVSHVNHIDRRSSAARRLQRAASVELNEGGWATIELGEQDDELNHAVVTGGDQIRLVGLSESAEHPSDPEYVRQFHRFVVHAELALRQVGRVESIPGGRLLAGLATKGHRAPNRWIRPVIASAVLTVLIVVALFPLPLNVIARATIRPADVQSIKIPRDAVVREVHVEHEQLVQPGQPLVTLIDPSLEREITELMGRRSVLAEKQTRWTNTLVETPSSQIEKHQQLLGQRSLVVEEIASLDRQLQLLTGIRDSLVIRADRTGVVDRWRIRDRLQGRPLRRGDHLLAIIAEDSGWVAEAQIPHNRISHVKGALVSGSLDTHVLLDTDSDYRWQATLTNIGPALAGTADSLPTTSALLTLDDPQDETSAANDFSGAPAQVIFHCGHAPLAYLMFQDLYRSFRGAIGLYFGASN